MPESLPHQRGQGGGPHGEEEGEGGPGKQRPGGQALPGQISLNPFKTVVSSLETLFPCESCISLLETVLVLLQIYFLSWKLYFNYLEAVFLLLETVFSFLETNFLSWKL